MRRHRSRRPMIKTALANPHDACRDKEGPPRLLERPTLSTHAFQRRQTSADVGDALLGFRLGGGRRPHRKLEYCGLLTVAQIGQENDLSVRKFECVVMHPRRVL